MGMKIYIATKTDNFHRARDIRDVFIRTGHSITFDWTEVVGEVGPDAGLRNDTPRDELFRRTCAENDRKGVETADALVMLPYEGLCGTLIEVGMAIALRIPVMVLGEPDRNSVFFSLRGVYLVPDSANFIKYTEAAVRHATHMRAYPYEGL